MEYHKKIENFDDGIRTVEDIRDTSTIHEFNKTKNRQYKTKLEQEIESIKSEYPPIFSRFL